jgi:hypothetical protein
MDNHKQTKRRLKAICMIIKAVPEERDYKKPYSSDAQLADQNDR